MHTTHPPTLLERATSHWWLYLLLAICFMLPAYVALPFSPQDTPKLVIEALSHALIYSAAFAFPFFKLVPLVVLALVFAQPERFSRWWYGWAAFNLLLIAVFQNVAMTPTYGFALLVGNVVVFTITCLVFARAAVRGKEPLRFAKLPWWRYWVVPVALLAFWFPVNTGAVTPVPDFSLARFFLNEAGLTGCMMLPVYLAVLTLTYPAANVTVLRVAGWIGVMTGLLNVGEFFLNASYGWWLGIVHLPLLVISIYAFVLGLRRHVLPQVFPGEVSVT